MEENVKNEKVNRRAFSFFILLRKTMIIYHIDRFYYRPNPNHKLA